MSEFGKLDDAERATYEWQMSVPGFGERGQEALKQSSVLITRCGGVGSASAYYLAAAGVGRIVLAHAGNIKSSDLHRQILMTHAGLGSSRVQSAARRLRELNPHIKIEAVESNVTDENAARLVGSVDLVVDCAPMFEERFLLNRESVLQKKTLVECAMYDLEAQITTIVPGKTACLNCLYPETPPAWKRRFPVFGAVAGMAGTIGAMEAIKSISGIGEPLYGRMLLCNLREMTFRTLKIKRNPACSVCGSLTSPSGEKD